MNAGVDQGIVVIFQNRLDNPAGKDCGQPGKERI